MVVAVADGRHDGAGKGGSGLFVQAVVRGRGFLHMTELHLHHEFSHGAVLAQWQMHQGRLVGEQNEGGDVDRCGPMQVRSRKSEGRRREKGGEYIRPVNGKEQRTVKC